MNPVENLKKIFLSFKAGTTPHTMDLHPSPPEFDFIFAIAPGGMTPFEYKLIGKSKGECISIHLKKQDYQQFFEHLQPPLWNLFDAHAELFLQATIVDVATVEHREIIAAMTNIVKNTDSGCGGDCGCGCG